jgi:hypothetical protein
MNKFFVQIPLNSISKACLETVHAIVKTDLYHDDNKQYNSSNLEILKVLSTYGLKFDGDNPQFSVESSRRWQDSKVRGN